MNLRELTEEIVSTYTYDTAKSPKVLVSVNGKHHEVTGAYMRGDNVMVITTKEEK